MKYAENNRISHRQLYRQMILALMSPLLLTLTGRISGRNGVLAAGIAAALLCVYVFLLMRVSPCYTDTVRIMGQVPGRIVGIFFLGYILLTGGFLLHILGEILPVWLLSGISVRWLLLLAVLVCGPGTYKGMQRRGRMAEVSGGILLWGILFMMGLSLGQSKMEYFREMFQEGEASVSVREILRQTYVILCGFCGISMLPFVGKQVEKRGSAGRTVVWGILTVTGILMGMTLLLPSVLGWERVKEEAWPILPLMAGADLPGNVLARFDILWLGFLLYGILFAVGSLLHYGHEIIARTHLGTGRYWMAVVIYIFALTDISEIYLQYLEYVFVPGVLLIQLGMLAGKGKKFRRKQAAAGILFLCLLFSGCAAIEPEKRMYPLAMGIQESNGEFRLSYGMPDLPQATGQGKPEEEKSASVLTITGKDFHEIEANYNQSQEKYLDIGHLQVILLSDEILQGEKWKEFLSYIKKEPLAGENSYLFRTEDPEKILNWNNGGTTAGEYLKGLLENRLPEDKKEGVTLRQAYYQWYKDSTLPEFPRILLEGEELQVL